MWQKCPICNGTGKVFNNGTTSAINRQCDVCQGKKIISKLNGLPPIYKQSKTELLKANISMQNNEVLKQYPSTDFRDGDFETQQEYFGK